MPATELVTVNLTRENEKEEWGFELTGGGRDKNVRLYIESIKPGSIAEKVGLKIKDSLVKIGNDCALDYTIEEAHESLQRGKDFFDMIVERDCVGRKISYEKSATAFSVKLGTRKTEVIQEFDAFVSNVGVDTSREAPDVVLQHDLIEDPRYQGLKKQDREKVGFHDVSKPTLRKDWNCPWIRRDGKGIKKVLRPEEKNTAPIRTSHCHFYSEPGSILAPDAPPMAPEELEKLIQERMGLLQAEEDAKRAKMTPKPEVPIQQPQIIEERFEQNKMEVEFSHQQQVQQQESRQQEAPVAQAVVEDNGFDEEDSCPPDLEAVEVVQQVPPQSQPSSAAAPFLSALGADSDLIRNLAIAIKTGMEAYQGSTDTYEPSADELIDVLKNLENLAAANPALYRAIVDQIKGHQPQQVYEEVETNGHDIADEEVIHEQQGYSEVDQVEQESIQVNGIEEPSEPDHAVPQIQKSPEELKQEEREARIKAEVDKEHEEQMRRMKERKQKEKEPPPPPKTITVMAGGRNRPSWPIAPGIANANQPRQITIVSGEDEEELYKNRIEVAQAAGLKHVEIIHGDENFYPTPMKDYDYPWSGSLRPVSNKMGRGSRAGGRNEDDSASPWAGSLKHVDPNKLRKKKQKQREDDDLYGSAPWMGTLRHVKHENKVTASLPKPQFKKYPDEDAPNPFESMQGRDAKPVWPLTPAAVIPAGGSSSSARKDRAQMEEVERITAGLRETRTVSSALLKALMPKLLKEHESKYEPLGHDESFNIMEEILAMQVGLGMEGKVEDNDEAEQMIRAITHGEINNAVYSKMADDLEAAAKLKKKEKSKKKKKKKTAKTEGGGGTSASELATSASESVVGSAA